MKKIRIGIVGYGNLGKGVHMAIGQNNDMEAVALFSRRDSSKINLIKNDIKVLPMEKLLEYENKIDVLILCGGSATDLPQQSHIIAKSFNIVDSFDNHSQIPNHFERVNKASMETQHTAVISAGWDPGLFSLNRLISEAALPVGKTYTFWGEGVSQGHSDAIRRIEGVANACQYTIPIEETVKKVQNGSNKEFSSREKHLRRCFVVLEDGADQEKVKNEIVTMPAYFADYDTEVNFISAQEFAENHTKMPHGGVVIRSGKTGLEKENNELYQFSLKLDSNPQFTSSVLVAFARAAFRMKEQKDFGAKTVFDIKPSFLSVKTDEELRKEIL